MIDLPWNSLAPILREDIQPGYHMALLCPTRGGKTTLAIKGLIPNFKDCLIIDSTDDPKPPMLDYGKPLSKYGSIEGHTRLTTTDISPESAGKIHKALFRAFKQGDVCIYIDEVRQVADPSFLGLKPALEHLWLFAGKRNVTIIGATQAPRWVPSSFYDQSRLHFLFRIRDKRAQKRVEEIGGDIDTLKPLLPTLQKYEFAYVNPDGDVMGVSMFPYTQKSANVERGSKPRYTLVDGQKRRIGRLNIEEKS